MVSLKLNPLIRGAKMENVVWVENSELHIAYKRWDEGWPLKDVCDWGRFLDETFLPPESGEGSHNEIFWAVKIKGAERIKILNGPNHKALLRVLAIKYVDGLF